MSYFPFFIELTGKRGLILGGGRTACHKVEKLRPFGPSLTVVARELAQELAEDPSITCIQGEFREEYLEQADFVIAATDDRDLNKRVFELCTERRILINSVDDRESCGFIFPSLVTRGSLTVGISTGGASPSAAVALKRQIESILPEKLPEILSFLDGARLLVKQSLPEEKDRSVCLKALYAACMERGDGLTQVELEQILRQYGAKI